MSVDLNDPRLTAFALGELDDETDRQALEAELANDREALAFIEGIRETALLLSEELQRESAPAVLASPLLQKTIELELQGDEHPATLPISAAGTGGVSGTGAARFPWIRLSLAAGVVTLVGGSLFLIQQTAMDRPNGRIELASNATPAAPAMHPAPRSAAPESATGPMVAFNDPAKLSVVNGELADLPAANSAEAPAPAATASRRTFSAPVTAPALPTERFGTSNESLQRNQLAERGAASGAKDPSGVTAGTPLAATSSKPYSYAASASPPPQAPGGVGQQGRSPQMSNAPAAGDPYLANSSQFGRDKSEAASAAAPMYRSGGMGGGGAAGPGGGGAGLRGLGMNTAGGSPGAAGGMPGGQEYRVQRSPGRSAPGTPAPAEPMLAADRKRAASASEGLDLAVKQKQLSGSTATGLGEAVTLKSNMDGKNANAHFDTLAGQDSQNGQNVQKKLADLSQKQKPQGEASRPEMDGIKAQQQINGPAQPAHGVEALALLNDFDGKQAKPGLPDLKDGEAKERQVEQEAAPLAKRDEVNGEQFAPIVDNAFLPVRGNELSTFSIDVDTASYANVRRFLNQNQRPPKDAVRIEEMLNYFTYNDPGPKDDKPFAFNVEFAACPWNSENRLVRVGLKAKTIESDKRPASNLVFLIDVSGSMSDLNKLPLLKAGMKLLVDQLSENDRVAIVIYASDVRVHLPSTPCNRKKVIIDALETLQSGGSTAGGAGIDLAYREAVQNFIKGGTNRVILATDGDFNVGKSKEELLKESEDRAKSGVFLTVLGFGEGNLQEAFMEQLADKGNGQYAYIDTIAEARKVLVREMSGTLVTVAKDVKIQVEFNPSKVQSYRLIGYENRVMAAQDFRNDKKDAGEIGAGHGVTALYEITPVGAGKATQLASKGDRPLKYKDSAPVDPKTLKTPAPAEASPESLTLFLRYKAPDADVAKEIEQGVVDKGQTFGQASPDLKFAASVAGFGMLLRDSPYKGSLTFSGVAEIATAASLGDKTGYRAEFVELVKKAQTLLGQ